MINIQIVLDAGAEMPEKAHEGDAGFDIYLPVKNKYAAGFTLYKGSSMTVNTGVHMLIPYGYCGLLVSKSGLNVKNGITGTGLIDAGYTGSIVVKLYNDVMESHHFHIGDKLIQIIILPVPEVVLSKVAKLPETERGASGFGSTGR